MKDYPGEQWKTVTFDFSFTNEFRLLVSNYGRLRTFNKLSNGNIINGSMVNGYRIVRLKLFKERDPKTQAVLENLQKQVALVSAKLRGLKASGGTPEAIADTAALLEATKKVLRKKMTQDQKARTINYHALVHRLVATYFLPKPTEEKTVVAHLDHDKLNNRASNLRWMSPEENYAHQKGSPLVIKDKESRQERQRLNPTASKLTVTRVMLLKKLLNEGKPTRQLVKLFKITEMQISRIRRGQNWADVPAAT